MRQNSTYNYSWITFIALAIFMNFAFAQNVSVSKSDTSFLHKSKNKISYFKNGLHLTLPPIKPAVTSNIKLSVSKADDKLLSNVQVYPNPVTDQINLKYNLSRNSNVTIKIMDVLGNEIITLFSQHVDSGEQKYTYIINNKLSNGFYFVRIVAGTESVIKRISVL